MTIRRRILVCGAVAALFLGAGFEWYSHDPFSPGADRIILLVPDGTSFSKPEVSAWLDAGNEEGLHVVPMHDSTFIRPVFPRPPCAGVILPDSIHGQASDLFVGSIRDYVATGGHLMLVYDAAAESLQGFYSGAVSYTHLDVYKRQLLPSGPSRQMVNCKSLKELIGCSWA